MKKNAATKIDVLDHGFVRLVAHMGDDLSIVRAARVSYDAAWPAGEDAAQMIGSFAICGPTRTQVHSSRLNFNSR
jgi:hypothetical protein